RPGLAPGRFFSAGRLPYPCGGLTNSRWLPYTYRPMGSGPTRFRQRTAEENDSQPGRANAPGTCGRYGMLERLEQQKKLTANQWKLICTANVADLLDFFDFFLIFVGIGNAGIFTIDLPLVQEFMPAHKRGWVSALITTLLPAGSMLAGIIAASLLPVIGWRGLFLIGLSPLVLVFMIRYWVPESPRWLLRMGRVEEARKSLAWALMIDPKEIELPATVPTPEQTRWLELFKYPRLVAAGCLTGMTQTGGASFGLWGATLLVVVLNTSPAHAAFLMIFFNLAGILGRFSITALIEPLGRRGSGTLHCVMS